MNAPQELNTQNPLAEEMQAAIEAQRADYLREGVVTSIDSAVIL